MHTAVKYLGVLTTDAELRVRAWDPWLAEATGLSEEQVRDRSLLELFPEINERGLLPRLKRALEAGSVEVLAPAFHQYLIRCPARGALPHFDVMQQHVSIAPLRDAFGITGLAITIEDVTARVVRDRELAAQLKSEDEEIRLRAARMLSEDSTYVEPLLGVLDDSSWQVRRAAVAGVARSTEDAVLERLIEAVRDHHSDFALLNAALSALTASSLDAVPHLIPLLKNEHADVRVYTALTLGNLKDARAVPALVGLLHDDDANVRFHAIEALGRIGARDAALPLARVLEERDPFLAFAAIDALGAIGERSLAPAIQAALSDDILAPSAVGALATLGNEQSASAIARVLAADGVAPALACNAIDSIYARLESDYGEGELVADVVRAEISAPTTARLIDALAGAGKNDRSAITRVLGWIDDASVIGPLSAMLTYGDARRCAIEALVRRGSAATAAVMSQLSSEDADVRTAAAVTLGRIGSPDAVPALADLLLDNELDTVIASAAALAAIGDARALLPLIGVLAHPNAAARHAAVSAINSIGHPDTAQYVADLLQDEDVHVRESAVRIAGYFGYAACADAVIDALRDDAEPVRRAAADHLGFFEDERVAGALAGALTDTQASVRAAAARALVHIPQEDAIPHIAQALADGDARVRYQAIQVIGTLGLTDFAPQLAALLRNDQAFPVRIATARALGDLGSVDATSLLADIAEHPESDLSCAALAALGRLPTSAARAALERALMRSDGRVQIAALEAIEIRHAEALLALLLHVARQSTDDQVAAKAIEILARHADDVTIDGLVDLLASPQRRAAVLSALSGAHEHVARIARGLHHADPTVRAATVEALARMKRGNASHVLSAALQDPDAAVRFTTEQALARLDLHAGMWDR